MKILLNFEELIEKVNKLKKKENYKEAIDILEDLYRNSPNSEEIKSLLIETLFSFGGYLNDTYVEKYKEAEAIFRQIIEMEPNNYRAHYNLGIAYFNLHKIELAIKSYEIALKLKPDYKHCIYNLGLVYEELGNYKKALEYYEKALEIDPMFTYALQARYDVRNKMDSLKKIY